MNDIAIYGAGGFGRETALLIEQINRSEPSWNLLGFYDDGIKKNERIDGLPVLGGLEDVNALTTPISLVLAIAEPEARMKIAGCIDNAVVSFPIIAHPQALLGSSLNWIGKGSIITAGCIVTTGVGLGEFVIVNLSTTLGHDVKIGSFCSVMPGCSISGNVHIGERTLIGTGARILQNLQIGQRCKIGAGSVVTKSYGNDLVLIGIPAYPLDKDHKRMMW